MLLKHNTVPRLWSKPDLFMLLCLETPDQWDLLNWAPKNDFLRSLRGWKSSFVSERTGQQAALWIVVGLGPTERTNDTTSTHKDWFIRTGRDIRLGPKQAGSSRKQQMRDGRAPHCKSTCFSLSAKICEMFTKDWRKDNGNAGKSVFIVLSFTFYVNMRLFRFQL